MDQLRFRAFGTYAPGGFTLLELLVSMAIIGILAAIAVPSYSKFVNRSRARGAATDLVALSLVFENDFQKTLVYPAYAAGTVIPALPSNRTGTMSTDFGAWAPAESVYFTYSVSSTAGDYAVTAVEQGTFNCTMSINNGNIRTASGGDCGFTSW